jgi:hypothetical protein
VLVRQTQRTYPLDAVRVEGAVRALLKVRVGSVHVCGSCV